METIKTVINPIKPEDIGWCQCHEHIFLADGPSRKQNSALYMDDYDKSLNELLLYKKAGGKTLVDCQPGGFGRMTKNLVKASKESDVNIVAVTGFHKLEFAEDLEYWENKSTEHIAQKWIDEIRTGMYENDKQLENRAGVIKCALASNRNQMKEVYDKLFEAARISAKETKSPVLFHVDNDVDVRDTIDYFDKDKVDSNKLIFCHLDRANYDFEYHREVASMGVYLEYDTINRLKYHSNHDEVKLIKHMIEMGFSENLLMGMDTTNQRLKSYGAKFGLDYILNNFKAQLYESEIEEQVVTRIMVNNPARALSF